MKKLRIGIEVQRLFREKRHGMEVVSLEIIKEVQRLDAKNDYFLYVRKDVNENVILQKDNFQIRSIPGQNYFFWEQFLFPREAKKDSLDFVHSTCNTSAIFSPVPVVLTLHDIIYLEKLDFKGTPYQNFGNIYRRLIVPQIVQKSKKIITVSSFEKDAILQKFDIADAKVEVIYNAVNPMFTDKLPSDKMDEVKRTYNLPENFILFLGNTAPKKNTDLVIKAYAEYASNEENPYKMVILDYDKTLVLRKLVEIGKGGCFPNFVFPGYIPQEIMPYIYGSSSLFLYPSKRESFGLPIIEAMACGVPVITSNISSMPEIAGDAAIFIDPFSWIELRDRIRQVLSDSELRADLKAKGIIRAKKFTWTQAAEKLLDVYSRVV